MAQSVTHASYFKFAARAKAIGFRKAVPWASFAAQRLHKKAPQAQPAAILGTAMAYHATGPIDDITAQYHTHSSKFFKC